MWGLSALADQRTGGLIMWIIGDMLMVTSALIVMAHWFRLGNERHGRDEARLDAAPGIWRSAAPGRATVVRRER
jgi:cytochrome c oxidase assembly factor CtaG